MGKFPTLWTVLTLFYGLLVKKDEPMLDRRSHQRGEIVDSEFGHQAGTMLLNRLNTDGQNLGNRVVRMPFSNELKDFSLARREELRRAFWQIPVSWHHQRVQDRVGDGRAQVDLPSTGRANGQRQLVGNRVLKEVAFYALLKQLVGDQ